MPSDSGRAAKCTQGDFPKKFIKQIYNFFDNTSVHGVKYLSEYRRPSLERILWLVSIVFSVIVCGYLINKSWEVRSSSPVILAMDKKQRPVWDIPFPALTICPTEKIRPPLGLRGEEEKDLNCAMDLVCENYHSTSSSDCKNASAIIKTLTKNAPQPDEIFVSTDAFETSIFLGAFNQTPQPLLSNGGLCYSFNMLPGSSIFRKNTFHASSEYLKYNESVDWDMENGYSSNKYPGSYPRRAVGAGEDLGLLVLLKNEFGTTANRTCNFIHGFEIQIHNPADFPSGERKYYAALNSLVQVFVNPEEVISDDLRSYTEDQRQCYYAGEHALEFFQVYTQKNCELECLSRVTYNCCGCVAFHMPRHENTSVCLTYDQSKCLVEAREWMHMTASGLAFSGSSPRCSKTKITCKCLPSCMQLRYRYQVAHAKMDRTRLENIYLSQYNVKDVEDSDFTIIQVLYSDSHFIPFRRLELYGTVEFLADCGGVLGLCLGVSVLSIVELLYWLLLRPWSRPRRPRRAPQGEAPPAADAAPLAPL